MKRFQDCNWLVKAWRRRHYLYIPFKWVWYNYVEYFYVADDETFIDERVDGRVLFKILIGDAQHKMGWYYTMEEIRARFNMNSESDDNNDDYIDLEDDIDETEYWKGVD